ncbi:MAG: OsmC family protein [Chloroflexota bacterium]|nr:OsmC family protein [Chloroflexota bacterium]
MAITLRMYADRKGWPLEEVRVRLRTSRSRAQDSERGDGPSEATITWLEREIELAGPLTEEQRQRLLQIADRCPVKRTLEQGIRVEGAS